MSNVHQTHPASFMKLFNQRRDFHFADEFLLGDMVGDLSFIENTIRRDGSISSNGLEFSLDGDYLIANTDNL